MLITKEPFVSITYDIYCLWPIGERILFPYGRNNKSCKGEKISMIALMLTISYFP